MLTDEQCTYLETHYNLAMNTPIGSSLPGNHWLFISVLNELGYSIGSLPEAYALAEQLLWPQSYNQSASLPVGGKEE